MKKEKSPRSRRKIQKENDRNHQLIAVVAFLGRVGHEVLVGKAAESLRDIRVVEHLESFGLVLDFSLTTFLGVFFGSLESRFEESILVLFPVLGDLGAHGLFAIALDGVVGFLVVRIIFKIL